jgi:hypothetical protein
VLGREPVRDLVDRAVAADGDEQRRPAGSRLARELSKVLRLLGEERVAFEAELGSAPRDLGPAPARRAAGRRRVDEKDRARANGLR